MPSPDSKPDAELAPLTPAVFHILLALAGTLGRMKLFQAVKLGDAN